MNRIHEFNHSDHELSQGMMWKQLIKVASVILFIALISWRGISHFVRQNYDYEVPFAFNKSFSLRGIIVSKSFDLVIWFTYQFVFVQRINLISKIKIEWYTSDDDANQDDDHEQHHHQATIL